MKNLVSTDWLKKNIENVRIIDATWHMPNTKRNAQNEFSIIISKTLFFLI